MRLIDEILNAANDPVADRMSIGAIGKLAKVIKQTHPQCFEIADEVVQACAGVFSSRPSSVQAALSYARLPYSAVWIERVFVPQFGPDVPNADKPPPRRVGCLLLDDTDPGRPPLSKAVAIWAWSFDKAKMGIEDGETIHVAPFACAFDWHEPLKGAHGLTPDAMRYIREHRTARWHHYVDDPREQDAIQRLAKHHGLIPNPYAEGFWRNLDLPINKVYDVNDPRLTSLQRSVLASLIDDLAGEDVIVTGFLLMLNSRNALTRTREDLTRLNRARTRRAKPPLTEFIKTSLTLPNHLGRTVGPQASEAERAAARAHLVRGHYKIRKSGVFWWSPHPRGRGQPVVQRELYKTRIG